MAGYIPGVQQDTGNYIQQTPLFDIGRLYEVEFGSEEFKELFVQLCQQLNNVSISTNNKVNGYRLQEEFVNGKLYFATNPSNPPNQLDLRPNYTTVVYFAALNAGANAQNHDIAIDARTTFTEINGSANDIPGNNYYPLPFVSAAGATNIEVRVNATQVIVTNNSGIVFGPSYVVLQYMKIL